MKNSIAFLLLVFYLLPACSPEKSPNSDAEKKETPSAQISPADEDDIIMRLSADLVADPQTQAQVDQNKIVNYAIDNLLDIQRTRSGLYFQILREGQGAKLQWGDRIAAHYRGYFLDGRVFDSSYAREKPMEFYIGNMIDGWNEGLQLLRPGGKALFLVPSQLGYGEEGLKNKEKVLVPPDEVLVFEVEVIEKVEG